MSVEAIVRDYLRSSDAVMSLLNDDPKRCNIDWSGNLNATHVTIAVVGGGFHSYLALQVPTLVCHCFGSTRSAAADVAEAVATEIRNIHEGFRPLASGEVLSVSYLPTTDGVSRYLVTATVITKLGLTA